MYKSKRVLVIVIPMEQTKVAQLAPIFLYSLIVKWEEPTRHISWSTDNYKNKAEEAKYYTNYFDHSAEGSNITAVGFGDGELKDEDVFFYGK